jgi:hypothetical protein
MRTAAIAILNSILIMGGNFSGAGVPSQTFDDQSLPQSSRPAPKIEVRLTLPKPSIASGAPVLVRVELRNVGSEPIFVPSKVPVNAGGDPGDLEVRLRDSNGHWLPGRTGAADRIGPPREDFYKLLFEYWVVLPPGYSYGTTADLTYGPFIGTLKPGRYQITASYGAYGMDSKNMNNPLGAYLDRISSLPYASWEGVAVCKPIWLEITSAPLRTKRPS